MKTRKLISLFLCLSLMLALCINPAYAANSASSNERTNPIQQQNEFNKAVDVLQKYLKLNADGTILLDAPNKIIKKIDKNTFAGIQAGIEQTNEMIKSGELSCDKDFNLSVTQKYKDDVVAASPNATVKVSTNSIAITNSAGGVTKINWYWWGFYLFLNHQLTQNVANGSAWAGSIMAIFGATKAWIGRIVCASLATLTLVLKSYDNGNGVYLKYNYAVVGGLPSVVWTGIWSQ